MKLAPIELNGALYCSAHQDFSHAAGLPNYLLLIDRKKVYPKEQRPLVRIFSDKNKQKFLEEITV